MVVKLWVKVGTDESTEMYYMGPADIETGPSTERAFDYRYMGLNSRNI